MSPLEDWGLTADDDAFHPVDDNPWFTETWWSAWMVPERKMLGYVYPMFRPNLGVQAGGVLMFDDTAELEWDLPVFDYSGHEPIAPGLDLRNLELPNSLTIKVLEPARHFEITYDGRKMQLQLDLEGVIRPMVTQATPPFNKGHIDQITKTLRGCGCGERTPASAIRSTASPSTRRRRASPRIPSASTGT